MPRFDKLVAVRAPRWSAKMDVWAERIDQAVEARDREIAELRERLIKLEKKSA